MREQIRHWFNNTPHDMGKEEFEQLMAIIESPSDPSGYTKRGVTLALSGEPTMDTVGDLRELLKPFTDECPITSIEVDYVDEPSGARLNIRLV
ncbi:MAG: hypothetical protein ABW134_11650 [Candidatus Thiodiazotropha endolucinida]